MCEDFGKICVGHTLTVGEHYDTDSHPRDVDMKTEKPWESWYLV